MDTNGTSPSWTFLTSHARVLIMIARNPEIRLRDIAAAADITERTAQNIVTDLEEAGYLTRVRQGRRNHYMITPGTRFRHRAEADHEVAELLAMIIDPAQPTPETPREQARPDGTERTMFGARTMRPRARTNSAQ